ncbi:glycosyltransferase [Neobacillus massiliamazoniensis]|uniref:Glycosyl transferase family protein n=1 Tax=Neobacillus massiliamazoniensis TaxID=1499688 RepID=A0A0U1NQA6_9BACI|nr:glycosyltransferase [Neobacillus massiliamazoniensis]CRK80175.1 glycosyl transferase family protein [Neobacillus massiliamazoniensis]
MGRPLISIIVPIYNVERYLDKCVESLINQTMKNIEIILVDDGSPDNCPKICDNYALRDNRINVIHKNNTGLSDSRNVGLKIAKGDYILFVDSDDYINKKTCEYFYKHIIENSYDVIIGAAMKIEEGSTTDYSNSRGFKTNQCLKGKEFLKIGFKHGIVKMAVWCNLYNRKFLLENELFFKKGLLHEDEQWTPRVLLLANKVLVSDIRFYYYIIRDESITNTKKFKRNAKHIISTVKELYNLYEKIDDEELKILLNDYLVSLYLFAFRKGKLFEEDNKYINKSFVMKNSKRNKIKSFIFCISPKLYSELVTKIRK